MSDSELQSTAPEDVQAKAREIGWRPPTEFKGDPQKWVDADEYLRRGEEVLPLVKATNKRLEAQLGNVLDENRRLAAQVEEMRQSMDDIAKFNAEQLQQRLTEQKRELTARLREARKEDDDRAIEELEEALEENADARQKLKEKPAPTKREDGGQQTPQTTPEFEAWKGRNTWFGGSSTLDLAKTAAAQAFGAKAAAAGKRGQAFFDAIDEMLAEAYPAPAKRSDPTEEGRPSGGGGSSSSRASGFSSLPAEAKAKAREQSSRFVGPNKMFKKEEEWFSYFAKQYNAEAA